MIEIELKEKDTALVQGTTRVRGIVLPEFNFNEILLGLNLRYFAQNPLDKISYKKLLLYFIFIVKTSKLF